MTKEMSNRIKVKQFEFAYKMAFQDATNRNAFPRLYSEKYSGIESIEIKKKADELFRIRKKEIKDYSKPIVLEFIKKIFADRDENIPDPENTIIKLCDDHNSERRFKFGNAQKLVNMTVKYMFLATYGDEELRDRFRNCHCPMDRVMIGVINRELPDARFDSELSWSKLDLVDGKIPKVYIKFQENIKRLAEKAMQEELSQDIMPIEVDYLYWDD